MSVSLIAPNDPITYQGFWQIETDKSYRFGQTIWVAIITIKTLKNAPQLGSLRAIIVRS